MEFLGRANSDYMWTPSDEMYICSDHFKHEMLKGSPGKWQAIKDGFPSLKAGVDLFHSDETHMDSQYEVGTENVIALRLTSKQTDNQFGKQNEDVGAVSSMSRTLDSTTDESAREELQVYEETVFHDTICTLEEMVKSRNDELKSLKQKCHRLENGKRKLREQLKERKRQPKEVEDPPRPYTLLDELHARQKMRKNAPYSDRIKDFAFQTHFYSARSYRNVKEELNVLPHPRTLSRWTENIPSNPGFLPTSLHFMKKLSDESKEKLYFAVSLDEVYTKKELEHDEEGIVGYTDYGGIIPNDEADKVATTALFLMATLINGKYKFPIGYLLTNGLSAQQLSKVIKKTLEVMHEHNSRAISITFDGLTTNLTAAKLLGANLDVQNENFNPRILHPITNEDVYIILDPSHMMKLIRNFWNTARVFKIGENDEICWCYIEKLQSLQKKCGLRLANKLSTRHVSFTNQKMKTNLCVQTLSNSVAVALGVCRELEIEEFSETEATENFLRIIDRLFDLLNSKSSGKGWKAPLRKTNVNAWKGVFAKCKEYLPTLMVERKGKVVPIIKTAKKTALIGLLTTIRSVELIMENIVFNPDEDLEYLPVYKLSQDMIETFFSHLRSRFGFNNNPSALQLRRNLRAILCMNTKSIGTGNCFEQEEMFTRVSPLSRLDTMMSQSPNPVFENDEEEDKLCLQELVPPASLTLIGNIIAYIAGFIEKTICSKLKCPSCICKLGLTTDDVEKVQKDCILTLNRDNGGLFYPSHALISVCKIAETVIRRNRRKGLRQMKKSRITSLIFKECYEKNCLTLLECPNGGGSGENHVTQLLRDIASLYSKVRLHYIAKEASLKINPTTVRSKCHNEIQFNGN